MSEPNYELVGRFIFSTLRYGRETKDLANWFADELEMARPDPADEQAFIPLYQAWVEKFPDHADQQARYARYLESLRA